MRSKTRNKTHSKTYSKTYSKTRTRKRTPTRKSTPKAGEAIAAGGFGCVFKPPIHCRQGSTNSYDADGISKLMLGRHVTDEMEEIKKVKPFINKIPHKERYFLVDGISSCNPGRLSASDKKNFNEKCRNLTERGINTNNVNTKLKSLGMINIPYGGVDLDKYWGKWWATTPPDLTRKLFAATNNSLIRLLKFGIVPLNAHHFLHMDIKGGNILRDGAVDSTNINCRLIDWGLSTSYNPTGGIPEAVRDKVIQFNCPFSIILFKTGLKTFVQTQLRKTADPSAKYLNDKKTGDKEILRALAYNILLDSAIYLGFGHLRYVCEYIFKGLFKPLVHSGGDASSHIFYNTTTTLATLFGTNIIVDYLTEILFTYVVRGKDGQMTHIDFVKYFHEVFVHNVDVWGFLMSYLSIVELAEREGGSGGDAPWHHPLSNPIARIILKYCFGTQYAATKIPVNELIDDLLFLNKIVGQPTTLDAFKPATPAVAAPVVAPVVAKKPKQKLVLVSKSSQKTKKLKKSSQLRRQALVANGAPFTWEGPGKKRCPKGSRRTKDKKCQRK